MNAHQPVATERGVKCGAEGCFWAAYGTIKPERYDWAIRDHRAQYEPGRAPDIEVDWEPSAWCSVCDDSIGDVVVDSDGEGLVCKACRTRWSITGDSGKTAEAD